MLVVGCNYRTLEKTFSTTRVLVSIFADKQLFSAFFVFPNRSVELVYQSIPRPKRKKKFID